MDVASYSRWNDTIGDFDVNVILSRLDLVELPSFPADGLRMSFDEIEQLPAEPKTVDLRVLSVCASKSLDADLSVG